jgi:large subunit ribosomal protein L24
MRLKTGDTVRVILGRDRGKQGKVLAVLPQEERVVVEGLNMVKKHVRARRAGEKGQRVSIAAPLHISNVQVVCPSCKRAARIGVRRGEAGERIRFCKKCSATLE